MIETRTTVCPLDCPDACSLEVTVEDGRATRIAATDANPYTAGFLCSKVRAYPEHVYHRTRLARPLVRTGAKGAGEFREAGWDEALDLVAARLGEARERDGETILPLRYGGSNGNLTDWATDGALFARLGASRLLRSVCALTTSTVANELYGGMHGVSFEDYPAAQQVVVWGANPEASGIHLIPILNRAQKDGTRIVVVDPRRTGLAKRADQHVQLKVGSDLPLALAVVRWLFEHGRADLDFLAAHANGWETLRERAEPWTLERAAAECGLEPVEIERFASSYANASPAVIRCGWGQERSRAGGSATAAIFALPAVAGKFGLRGGGFTLANKAAWKLAPAFDFDEPETREVNMNQVGRVLLGAADPPIDVVVVYNSNPVMTLPEQGLVRRGFEREDLFTVVIDQVLTDSALLADVVLPCTTFLEHREVANSYGSTVLYDGRPVIGPVGEARPNHAIFRALLERLDLVRPGDPVTEADLAANVLRGNDVAAAELERAGIALPAREAPPVQFVDVRPATASGRIELLPPALEAGAPEGLYRWPGTHEVEGCPLVLLSPSTSRTISSSLGQLVEGLVALELHPTDAAARGIGDGDRVRIFNPSGSVETIARASDDLRPGECLLPKGLWSHNTLSGTTANSLAPDDLNDVAGGACFNDARVEVERIGGPPSGNGASDGA